MQNAGDQEVVCLLLLDVNGMEEVVPAGRKPTTAYQAAIEQCATIVDLSRDNLVDQLCRKSRRNGRHLPTRKHNQIGTYDAACKLDIN